VIDRRWLPLNALRAFEAVARHLSFTAGAQALNVTQSALSRHVISLERLIGCRLLERRPNGVALTEAGAALLPAVTKSFDRLELVMNDILRDGDDAPRRLRVHMPPSFLQKLALPVLRDFRQEFPDIAIDVASSPVTGLPAGDLDIAVIYDRPQIGNAVADLLWATRVTPVCAPAIARSCAGMSLARFLDHNELLHVRLEGEPRGVLWSRFARHCGLALDSGRGLTFDTGVLAVDYAMSGAGVALADIDMFAREIAEGSLVAPYDAVYEDGYAYYLTLQPEDLTDSAIAQFRSFVIARFARAAGSRNAPELSDASPQI